VGPVASDNAADFVVDIGNFVGAFLNLPADGCTLDALCLFIDIMFLDLSGAHHEAQSRCRLPVIPPSTCESGRVAIEGARQMTIATPTYSSLTFADGNPIKRWLQRSRLTAAVRMAQRLHPPRTILDFGAGNGELCKLLRSTYPHSQVLCYEPAPTLMAEAKENLWRTEGIEFLSQLDVVVPGNANLVFCLEVFEHLPPKEMTEALSDIARLLSEDGYLIIGVPIEIGLPALYKGLFRMTRRFGAFDATLTNILACAVGRPPLDRPILEICDGRWYHRDHVGFDHRRFQSTLSERFDIKAVCATPVPTLGVHINPEAYFLAQRRAVTPAPASLPADLSDLRGAA
jgi:SAM-dependent methyltransferase